MTSSYPLSYTAFYHAGRKKSIVTTYPQYCCLYMMLTFSANKYKDGWIQAVILASGIVSLFIKCYCIVSDNVAETP